VDVTMSKGPAPRVIPELTGAPQADAEAELAKLALAVKIVEEFSDSVGKGLVTRTDPAAGQSIAKGAPVTLFVSKGPDVVSVPNVVGMSLDDAVNKLEASGFQVNAQGPPRGRVFETDPPAGTTARRGSEVTIYLKR
jgi:beta-lactam-binding protein with PASTA domain